MQNYTAKITRLSHEGRGITQLAGITTFVDGALPGETVRLAIVRKNKRFWTARTLEVLQASPARRAPACPHFGICGGCNLQHLSQTAQLQHKQTVLQEQLLHFGAIQPQRWLPPIAGPSYHYRNKARLGVRWVDKKARLLLGFREKYHPRFLTDAHCCPILTTRFGEDFVMLRETLASLSVAKAIAQCELAGGDQQAAMIIRHLQPLSAEDETILYNFAERQGISLYLEPNKPQPLRRLYPQKDDDYLYYTLPKYDLELACHPTDFTQINLTINRLMVQQAVDHLALTARDHVLDLFCGLGNFSLPMARFAQRIIGLEGATSLVARANHNAERNQLNNCEFYKADLSQPDSLQRWIGEKITKLLLDPPRSGAAEVIAQLPKMRSLTRLVYVSCNPATLARDAGLLQAQGYQLVTAGILDMFPQTAHVESMAVFER